MKVIIDTNVLISGIFFGGPPAKILGAWHGGELLVTARCRGGSSAVE